MSIVGSAAIVYIIEVKANIALYIDGNYICSSDFHSNQSSFKQISSHILAVALITEKHRIQAGKNEHSMLRVRSERQIGKSKFYFVPISNVSTISPVCNTLVGHYFSIQVSWYEVYTSLRKVAHSVELKQPEVDQKTKYAGTALVRTQFWKHKPREPVKAAFLLHLTPDAFGQRKFYKELELHDLESVSIKWKRDTKQRLSSKSFGERAAAESPDNILSALNDDCLRKIFSQSVLDEQDFFEIAQTCQRFNWVAKDGFRSRYRRAVVRIYSYKWSLRQCEVFFKQFGPYIRKLSIYGSPIYTDIVMGLVGSYSPAVTYLATSRLDEISKAIFRAHIQKPVPFAKLVTLICYLKRVAAVRLPTNTLPKLRCFMLRNAVLMDPVNVEAFFAKNSKLKTLSLSIVNVRTPIECILRYLRQLNTLDFVGMLSARDKDIGQPAQIEQIFQLHHLATFKWKTLFNLMEWENTLLDRLSLSVNEFYFLFLSKCHTPSTDDARE